MRTPSSVAVLVAALLLGGCGGESSERPPVPMAAVPAPAGAGKPQPLKEGDPIAEMDAYIAERKISKQAKSWRLRLPAPIQVGFPKDKTVHWVLDTNKGRMVVRLWHTAAPLHASNLIYLTRLGFYDGLLFHRVIQTFMAQGGCPIGNGEGMPGYGLAPEVRSSVKHDRPGLLSTAHSPMPNSDGSQFFLTFRAAPELDMGYTVYGNIVEGLDTLRALEAAGAPPRAGSDAPRERLVIEKATVELR